MKRGLGRERLGQLIFWGGTIVVGLSTFAVLTVLAHRGHTGQLAAISAVFALSVITQVLPGAVQLNTAAVVAGGDGMALVPWRLIVGVAVGVALISPVLGSIMGVPALAVVLVAASFPPSVENSHRRGDLIGRARFGPVGANLGLEACFRLAGGIAFGWFWGATGVAFGLLVATIIAMARAPKPTLEVGRPTASVLGSLNQALLALGVLTVLVQLDVLIAPSVLSAAGADQYAAAAVPAKAIFLGLLAPRWIAVPTARSVQGRLEVLKPALIVATFGALCAVAAMAVFPLIAAILGQHHADRVLAGLLCTAMAIAAGTAVIVNLAVARRVSHCWAPLAPPVMIIAVMLVLRPGLRAFGVFVLLAHVVGFAAGSLQLMASGVQAKQVAPPSLADG